MVNRAQSVSPFLQAIRDHITVVEQLENQLELFEQIADRMIRTLRAGNNILWCGNGGTAADSQHLAAEIVGRFRRERRGSASIALTTDTSILTAVGNDYGYYAIFARQIEALCQAGDVVVGPTTSGNGQNVCNALQCARALGAFTVGMTGEGGGKLASMADACVLVASRDTARIQECHILFGHALCDRVECALCIEESEDLQVDRGRNPAVMK
jgi:D-sedoheptulose 7-phosphate isomerase